MQSINLGDVGIKREGVIRMLYQGGCIVILNTTPDSLYNVQLRHAIIDSYQDLKDVPI